MLTNRMMRFAWTVLLLATCAEPLFAQDSARPPWTTSQLNGTPVPPPKYKLVPAFPALSFVKPTSLREISGGRMLVSEIGGKVFSFTKDADTTDANLIFDLATLLPSDLRESGVSLWHVTPHPEFEINRFLFACYVHPGNGRHTRVSRFQLTENKPLAIVPGSEQVILTWPAGGHNAGCIEFGTDAMLYIATGDGAGPNPPDGLTTGQDVSDLLGSILRIDVDHPSAAHPYSVPTDNPFVALDNARPEVWAYGLRNPWKFGVDAKTGNIFAADNGWESWEMIHQIVRGGNCGWPIMEGRASLRSEVEPGPTPILPPIKDHPHSEANSVIGGPVYHGARLPELDGWFVYGDYITGTIWAVNGNGDQGYENVTLVDTDQRLIHFAEGTAGELFVLDYDFTGQIYELVPSGQQDNSAGFPRRLSETGLFSSLPDLKPAPGVVPWEVLVEPWMDGMQARRWIAIPGSAKLTLAADATQMIYPNGTVFVKHLALPLPGGDMLPVETQILHYEYDQWRPYSYFWTNGSDAELVDSIGTDQSLNVPDTRTKDGQTQRTWHVGAQNECRLCHNAGAAFVLGFRPEQLLQPQLSRLVKQHVLSTAPAASVALVDPHDTSQELNDRARSYLHVNCSMCHHPGGNAIVSFFLRRDLPFEKLNTNKGTGIGTFGIQDAKIIVPGDPYRSVLLYRMSKLGYARMPYIGSQVVDSQGITLIEQWIRSLGDSGQSAPLKDGTPENNGLTALAQPSADKLQRAAIRELLNSTEGTLALMGRAHAGRVDGDVVAAIAQENTLRSDVLGLVEHFIPESQRRARLGPNINPESILALRGDADRGRLIFFSDSARCRTCHDVNRADKSIGPTLAEINKQHPLRSDFLQHVLEPSLKVDENYATWTVLTVSGKVHSGLLLEQTPDQLVLKTAEGRTVTIPRSEIEETQQSKTSLMPAGILSDLTAQEAADLLSYVRGLGSQQ